MLRSGVLPIHEQLCKNTGDGGGFVEFSSGNAGRCPKRDTEFEQEPRPLGVLRPRGQRGHEKGRPDDVRAAVVQDDAADRDVQPGRPAVVLEWLTFREVFRETGRPSLENMRRGCVGTLRVDDDPRRGLFPRWAHNWYDTVVTTVSGFLWP